MVTATKRKYKPEGYKCPVPDCGAVFPTPQSLGGHMTSVHTGVNLDWIIMQKELLKQRKNQK